MKGSITILFSEIGSTEKIKCANGNVTHYNRTFHNLAPGMMKLQPPVADPNPRNCAITIEKICRGMEE